MHSYNLKVPNTRTHTQTQTHCSGWFFQNIQLPIQSFAFISICIGALLRNFVWASFCVERNVQSVSIHRFNIIFSFYSILPFHWTVAINKQEETSKSTKSHCYIAREFFMDSSFMILLRTFLIFRWKIKQRYAFSEFGNRKHTYTHFANSERWPLIFILHHRRITRYKRNHARDCC